MLFDVIQTITGSPINQKSFRAWKGDIFFHLINISFNAKCTFLILCCLCLLDSFLAATRELQRIYGKEERN